MKTRIDWKDGMVFTADVDSQQVTMDAKAPIGKGSAPTPKELVAIGLGGCTAMDVVALLKKYKQPLESLAIDIEVTPSQGKHPVVFESATLVFSAKGQIDGDKLVEAVQLSQTKFCGVSAMLSKAFPIHYRIELNGVEIGHGQADFSELA